MRVLLEGFGLARTRDTGGVDSYWRNLVPRLLDLAREDPGLHLGVLSAFLNPFRVRTLLPYRRRGASLHHWWLPPQLLGSLGRRRLPLEFFAGTHDLVHAVEPVWPFRSRGRLVVTCHDLMYRHHPQYLDPRWVRRLEEGTREAQRRATLWICVSEHTREDLIRHYHVPRGRTRVVYHGVDASFREAGLDSGAVEAVRAKRHLDKPYLLFLGSVEPKKNLRVLLRAYAHALRLGIGSELVVAGRAGWRSETVRRAVEEAPELRDRVRFTGFVDQEDLPGLVGGARALVLPSRYEGFGMPVLEAMAAGTPVLCSDRGALPEVAGGAALHFDADDEEALAGLLARIDGDDGLWEDLRRRGLERAAPFTWERCARETLEAWKHALSLPR